MGMNFQKIATVLILLTLAGTTCVVARDSFPATRTTMPPVLDGKLTEAGWQAASEITGFRQYGSETMATFQSIGYVLYDDSYLYFGVRCLEPNPANIQSEVKAHDANVWSDDGIEIMLKPDGNNSRYFQFIVNASGSIFDGLRDQGGVDPGWNGDATAVTTIGEDHWSAEVRIPFYVLGISPNVTSRWAFNICRNKTRPVEMSAVAREGQYNEPWKYKSLTHINADLTKYRIEVGSPQLVGDIKSGTLSASAAISVTNSTGKERRLRVGHFGGNAAADPLQTVQLPLASGQSTTVELGTVVLGPQADRNDVFRITAPPPTRRLVVSDADTGEKLVLANLQFPSEFKVLGLELVPSKPGDMATLPDGTLPLTIELTSSLPDPRQAGILILGVIEMETADMVTSRVVTNPDRVTRITLDRSSLPTGKLRITASICGTDGRWSLAKASHTYLNLPARESAGKVLNNLVTELLSLQGDELFSDQSSQATIEFNNPRNGWVFFSSTIDDQPGTGKSEIALQGETEDTIIIHSPGQSTTQEAMRWLRLGTHVLSVDASVEKLVVRAIPEISFFRYPASTHLPQQKTLFDWKTLQKYVLHNMNSISVAGVMTREPLRSKSQSELDAWKKEGKRWYAIGHVPAYKLGGDMTTQQAYEFWADNACYNDDAWAGIIVDEFSVGDYPVKTYVPMTEAVRRLTAEFPDKSFLPFCLSMYGAKEVKPFIEAVIDNGSQFVWEWYEREEPNEERARNKLTSGLVEGMKGWRNLVPEAQTHAILCLGYYSTPPISLNENPAVDYKVWKDMQYQRLATDPTFVGLYGLMEWNSKYADEETVRWQARLCRHYGIEGKTNLLSDEYGFRYNLTHLQNPDFDEGTTGWTVTPAAGDSVNTGTFTGLGRLEGRVRGSSRGDNFVRMRRSAKAPNRIVQEIKDLEPGRLYSIKMFTCDYQGLMKGKIDKQTHAVAMDLENVEMIEGFQQPFESQRGQEVPPFSGKNQPWLSYHWYVFRAAGDSARLVISDWLSDEEPGGPLGQELTFNFIEVQLYYAPESTP